MKKEHETWSLTQREECRLWVVAKKMLRRIFGFKRDEVIGEWRRLHGKELHALYASPNIIRVIKSRRLRWAGHVARMRPWRGAHRVLVGKPEGRNYLEERGVDGRIILKWICKKWDRGAMQGIDLAHDRDSWRALVNAVMNLRGSIKCGEFPDQLRTC